VGIGVALIFIIYGAPDVAITQLLVETLVVVLFAVAMLRLPRLDRAGARASPAGDALLAVARGDGDGGPAVGDERPSTGGSPTTSRRAGPRPSAATSST
jgi:hypothetical protein